MVNKVNLIPTHCFSLHEQSLPNFLLLEIIIYFNGLILYARAYNCTCMVLT
jgi:Tat protein secretion system quality control protein TatD with DNase activity